MPLKAFARSCESRRDEQLTRRRAGGASFLAPPDTRPKQGFKLFVIFPALFISMLLAAPLTRASDPVLPRSYVETAMPDVSSYAVKTLRINYPASGDYPATAAGLQQAINDAALGTIIDIEAGATIQTNSSLRLPNKPAGSGWIIIRSSSAQFGVGGAAPPGRRVSAADVNLMPELVTGHGSSPFFKTLPGAHHYRLTGLEIRAATTLSKLNRLLELGDDTTTQTTVESVPHHLIVDRCYVHGNANLGLDRAIALHASHAAVIDSDISEVHTIKDEAEGITSYNGGGPYKLVNNRIEASGINVLFGGAKSATKDHIPSDIEVRKNLFTKNLLWKDPLFSESIAAPSGVSVNAPGALSPGSTYYYRIVPVTRFAGTTADVNASAEVTVTVQAGHNAVRLDWTVPATLAPSAYKIYRTAVAPSLRDKESWIFYSLSDAAATSFTDLGAPPTGTKTQPTATRWGVKNLFELKAAKYILLEGNIFSYSWQQSQVGYGLKITSVDYNDPQIPEVFTEHLTMCNNIVRHVGIGLQLTGRDDPTTTNHTRMVLIQNNLFEDIDHTVWGGNGRFMMFQAGSAPADLPPDFPSDVTIDHNTVLQKDTALSIDAGAAPGATNFKWINNITGHNKYGVKGSQPAGKDSLNGNFNNAVFTRNVMAAGGKASSYEPDYTNNYFPAVWDDPSSTATDVGFVDYRNGQGGNYRLAGNSQFKGLGISHQTLLPDGTDLGADIDAVEAAVNPGETVLLQDGFGGPALDTTKWRKDNLATTVPTATSISVSQVDGVIKFSNFLSNTAGSNYNGITSNDLYDLRNAYCQMMVVTAPGSANNSAALQMLVAAHSAATNNHYRVSLERSGVELRIHRRLAGSTTTLHARAFDPVNHKFIRLRHDDSTGADRFIVEAAPSSAADVNAPGAWSELYSEAWAMFGGSSGIDPARVRFEIKAGTFSAEPNPVPVISVDNFKAARP